MRIRKPRIITAKEIPANMVGILQAEAQASGGVAEYPKSLQKRFNKSKFARTLIDLAEIVEPVDSVLGKDRNKYTAAAFTKGAFVGLRVVQACVDDVDSAFSGIALVPSPKEVGMKSHDQSHARHLIAEHILDLGDRGYARFDGVFGALFERWIDEVEPQVSFQRPVRSGFGVPLSYLSALYDKNRQDDLAVMGAEVESVASGRFELNWDELLN